MFIPVRLEDADPSSVVVMIDAVTIIGCSAAVLCFLPVECVWAKASGAMSEQVRIRIF